MNLTVLAQAAAEAAKPSTAELIVFVIIGALALGSAVSMVVLRHPVHSALMLVLNFFTIAVLYAVNEAQFLATVQIIVYAGAIMVLFLFVIMLLGVAKDEPARNDKIKGQKGAAVAFGLVLFAALTFAVAGPFLAQDSACPSPPPAQGEANDGLPCRGLVDANRDGNTEGIGALLFSRYVWPFEVTSVLLVIAAIGAMVLGRRDEDPADLVDRDETFDPPPDLTEPDEPAVDAEPAMIGQGNPAPSSDAFPEEEEQ